MTQPSYEIAIDLDNDGSFSDAGEDVTADVRNRPGVRVTRGRSEIRPLNRPIAGSAEYELDNVVDSYGLSSNVKKGRPTRMRATHSGVAYPLWHGTLDRPTLNPSRRRRSVSVQALGVFASLVGKRVSTELFTEITTGVAVAHLLDAAGIRKRLTEYAVDELGAAGWWGLGEASGDALDATAAGNDGTVTIGAGSRDAAAVDDDGDGAIDFDGAATRVEVPTDAALDGIFDGGGALTVGFNLDSDGEASAGRLLDKGGFILEAIDEAGGLVRLQFYHDFDGATDGRWRTGVVVPLGVDVQLTVSYDNGATGNDPTFVLADLEAGTIDVLTVGSGLTESTTPAGTRVSDAGTALNIGNDATGARTSDGRVDSVGLFTSALTTAQAQGLAARALAAPRKIDDGVAELAWWWLADEDAFSALITLLNTEGPGAALYEDGAGGIVFKSRHARFLESRSSAVQRTLRDSGTEPLHSEPFAYEDGSINVVNAVTLERRVREAQAEAAFWELGSTFNLGASESREFIVQAGGGDPFTAAVSPLVEDTDFSVDAGAVASATLDRSSGGSATLTVMAGASGCQVSGLQVRGQVVEVVGTAQLTQTIDVSASQSEHGEQPYTLAVRHELPLEQAVDLCNGLAYWYQDGRPIARVTLLNTNDTRITAQLASEIGDRVRILEAGFSIDDEFWIEGVSQRFTPYEQETRFACELAAQFTPFRLDVSELDGSDLIWI